MGNHLYFMKGVFEVDEMKISSKLMTKVISKLERVHIKRASKIIANMMTDRKSVLFFSRFHVSIIQLSCGFVNIYVNTL